MADLPRLLCSCLLCNSLCSLLQGLSREGPVTPFAPIDVSKVVEATRASVPLWWRAEGIDDPCVDICY